MSEIKVVLPYSGMVTVTHSTKDADSLMKAVVSRQQIAADYCIKKGWPTNPAELSFEQIFEIRKLPEWIEAGK